MKAKILNAKEVILDVFSCQKWGGEISKNHQNVKCVAKNIEGWLQIRTSYLV
jgi:hypothetical protein